MKMKMATGLLSSLLFSSTYAGDLNNIEYCIFGDNWLGMARMRNLEITHEKTLTLHSNLYQIEADQIKAAYNEPNDSYTAMELIDQADDDEIIAARIYDAAHDKVYYFYKRSSGDNSFGAIFYEGTTEKAANFIDSDIYDCKVTFENIDWLTNFGFY